MDQLVYSVTAHRGNTAFGGEQYLRLMASRCLAYEALEQSLAGCRSAYILSDVNAIMQWVELQSSHCNEILRLETSLASHLQTDISKIPAFLSPVEAERANELLQRTAEVKGKVRQLNSIYAGLVRKASHNNAVLQNLYATALVYADPRIGPRASCGKAEE